MREIILQLINRGFVAFNPFTMKIRDERYAVSTEDYMDWSIAEIPPETVIQNIIEMSHKYYDKLDIGDNYKYNFFWDIIAFDSNYDLSADICFDDYQEALEFGNKYELFNIADLYGDEEFDLPDTEE